MAAILLGIDIGTSACKVALFTPEGEVVAQANGDYEVYYPQPGWVEQNPVEWWEAVCRATREVLEKSGVDPSQIAGVGIDGQSWSAIPIDREGQVLCNTPIWMDTRSQEICEQLKGSIGEARIFELCGNPLQPVYTLPKILWYKQHRPELYQKIDKVLQSNSYIVYRLTGEISQDLSQGYGLQCFDLRRGRWDEDICREMGIDPSFLPAISACHEVVGRVTAEAAKATGLCEGTPVVAGGLDAACGTLGVGVIHDGQTQEQGGQSGGMSICIKDYNADLRLITGFHVVPDCWLLQGGTTAGGGAIRWFEKEFGASERMTAQKNGTGVYYEMDQLAAGVAPGSEGLIFLPYLSGERSPIWDPQAKGVYYGLDYGKTRAHMIRATLEGVAYALKHNLDTAEEAGSSVTELYSMGGGANSRLWTQIKADVTGKRILVPSSDTASTLGAAILAGVGVGVYGSFDEAVGRTVHVKRVHEPNLENYERYQHYYRTYLELYQDLKETMHRS